MDEVCAVGGDSGEPKEGVCREASLVDLDGEDTVIAELVEPLGGCEGCA